MTKSNFRTHLPYYFIVVALTLVVELLYLTNQASGGNWAWIGLPLDDTWIHLNYAKSFAQQGWFFYNPGIPEAGMSSPLWVLLLAAVYKVMTPLGVSPQWCAKGLSLLFALGVPIVTYHLALLLVPDRRWARVIGLLVILEPNLAYGNVSGMEVSLTTFLMLLAIWLCLLDKNALCGLVLGLLVITRAESVIVAVIIGVVQVAQRYLKREQVTLLRTA